MVEQTIIIDGKEFSTRNISFTKLKSLPKGIFDNLVNLEYLILEHNNFVSLSEGIFDNLINLKRLYLNNNNIGSLPHNIFDNLVNLESLHLSSNYISSLPKGFFDNLVNLEVLLLDNNKLTSLPEGIFDKLVNLEYLNISENKLTSLPEGIFDKLVKLKRFIISDNELTSLPNEIFANLVILYIIGLQYNNLTLLPYNIFENLVNLTTLDLSSNNLDSLPLSLRNCRRLERFYYDSNPIEYIPPQLRRFINRFENRAIQSISNDNQNVHDSAIQRSLNTSISNLLKEKPTLTTEEVVTFITNSEFITSEAKSYLLTYSEDETIHSVHDVTFSEVLTSVISEIISMEEDIQTEVLKILSEEISDSICKCFTGRISRLVNSLNGFSPKVKVEISKNTQISTILAQTSERIDMIDSEEEVTKIKEETIKNLREHEFTEEEIDGWMSYL